MGYAGSCHCGAVQFDVAADAPREAISCNCSHCRRKGLLLAFLPGDALSISTGEEQLTDYLFYKHAITHRFCRSCGCQPFARGTGPDGSVMAAVNLRCVPDVDLDALTIERADGASY